MPLAKGERKVNKVVRELTEQTEPLDDTFVELLVVSEDVADISTVAGSKALKLLMKDKKTKTEDFLRKARAVHKKADKSPAAQTEQVMGIMKTPAYQSSKQWFQN